MIRLVCFDLDGVLVNACEYHYLSLNRALMEVSGVEINRTDHETTFNGLPTRVKLNMLLESNKIKPENIVKIWDLKQQYTKNVVMENARADKIKILMLQYLVSCGIQIACVTNSIHETASLMLSTTGQLPYLNLLLTNDMIKHPKPHGEGYIRAMVRFNSMPEETLIVEDSPKGLLSAQSTGANVWAVGGYEDVTLENLMKELEKYL